MAGVLIQDLKEDLFSVAVPPKKRLWAYRRGFLGRRISEYGLNEGNWRNYEADFHYCKLHPLNEFSEWIDDKLTIKYILRPFSDLLPKYFFELKRGAVRRLMDCPHELAPDIPAVIRLLERERQLAIKPFSGTGGQGFYRLSVQDDRIYLNDELTDVDALKEFLSSLSGYLVTEYVVAHGFMRKIWSGAPNTLRVITIHNDNEAPVILGGYGRFGTSGTGAVDNIAAGGIACGIDVADGRLYGPKRQEGDTWVEVPVHPDTKLRIEGRLPYWDSVVQKLTEICNYLPHLKYMGFDIVITDVGFKIIEINSHTRIHIIQSYFPLLENEHARRLFRQSGEA